ncbi:MAG: cytochrome P450 [Hyphomicrobiales bacterium]|nr:cytochrome P450 [Hyphomicrobiales bacterium]
MSLATVASRPFVPPYPRRPRRPRGSLSILLALQRNPIEVWWEGDFERPVSIGRTIFGLRAAAHDPAAVRRVFLDNAANYRKDDLQLRILRPGLGNGLLTAEGEDWRVQRRALAPLFSPRQIAEFAPAVHRVGQAAVDRMIRRRDGAVADIGPVMSRLTLEVLEQTLFSQGLGREPTAFQRAVSSYFETIGRVDPLDLLGAPDFVPRLRRRRGRGALQFFDSAVDAIIEKRRELLSGGGEAPRDLLTLLMSAKDPENGRGIAEADVRANIVTFINAGHETTANALTWTLYLLSQSPEWRERAEADADQAFDDQGTVATEKCEILRAVFEEALRLYPPAAMLARQAIEDDKLGDVHIPAGTVVTISPFVLHRRRGLWDRPDAFDPSRFLGEQRDCIDRFAYIPFGAGPRVCIGMAFAIQEGIILLAHLLRAFRFDLVEGHVVMPLQRVTLRPREGLKMHVKRRDRAESFHSTKFSL